MNKQQFVIARDAGEANCWAVLEDGEFVGHYPANLKAGDVMRSIKDAFPDARVGCRASDIGPVVAAECIRQGYGNVLWLK